MARPKPALMLSDDERHKLTTWASRPKSTQRLALRARIVLACADEPSNKAVAARLGVCGATVGTGRTRFVAKRLDGLVDDPRPGAPRTVTDAEVERFFAEITEKRIRRGVFRSVPALAKAIANYLTAHNADPKPFVWVADADSILDHIKKVCESTSDSGH